MGPIDDAAAPGPQAPSAERLLYEFGPFVLRLSDRTLFRGSERIRITSRVLDLLLCLVEEAGRVVTKERLLERVWEGTFVEEGNVNRTVSTLRRTLEETEDHPYIETIPRQGYRFVAPVVRRVEPPSTVDAGPAPTVPAPLVDVPIPPAGEAPPSAPEPRPASRRPRRAQAVAVATLVVLAAAAGWWRIRSDTPPRSLAVLPFRFPAGVASAETLGVAVADAISVRLSRAGHLDVLPVTAVLRFRDGKTRPLEAARLLGVDVVVDGQVTREREGGRISLALIRRRDGKILLSEALLTASTDLPELRDAVAERIAGILLIRLAPPARQREARRLAATDLHARGRRLLSRRAAPADETVRLFRQAIETDPDFALAYVGLADALLAASLDSAPEAEEAARRALSIDDRLGPARATLGFLRMWRDWDWQKAGEELSGALELEPSYAPAWQWRGILLSLTGNADGARAALARAVELDPASPAVLCDAGFVALWRGEVDEARTFLSRALAIAPLAPSAAELQRSIAEEERPDEARRRAVETLRAEGIEPSGALRATPGNELLVARSLARTGRPGPALAWLGEAVRQRRHASPLAAVDPAYRALRNDPEFVALLLSMGLGASGG